MQTVSGINFSPYALPARRSCISQRLNLQGYEVLPNGKLFRPRPPVLVLKLWQLKAFHGIPCYLHIIGHWARKGGRVSGHDGK